MVDQLSAFAAEVTRVAREVGTEGVLGGQAEVADVSGVWRELTQNVNGMASNLTSQVRNIAEVVTAIAGGDLSKKIGVDARGEILALKNTINTHGRQAEPVLRRGDARRASRRYGRHARRHRRRQGRVGHLEGADRQRQPDGEEPDQPGSRHRRGDDRRRERRPRPARSPSKRAASSSR